MRILIVPMSAVAQTEGPFSRAETLAKAFLNRQMQVALCAGANANSRLVDGVTYYSLSVPVPMGLPKWIALRTYPLADKLGIIGRKTVHSFEEVLHLTGASAYPYIKVSIEEIRTAIRHYQPDIVYSEFNLSAIVAAKAEGKPVFASYSFPTQSSYAASPQFAGGMNRVLMELQQPQVRSALDLFLRADCRVIPSSYMLEPIVGENCLFVGPLKKAPPVQVSGRKNSILVYMGNGTVSKKRIRQTIFKAFHSASYEVYVAGMDVQEDCGNIHFARRFDFSKLLPNTAVYINHGGQNSIMDGFLCGVPQLICPGRVFERKYNADSVEKNGAGITINLPEFQADVVSKVVERLVSEKSFRNNAEKLGRSLSGLGGADAVADYIANHL